MRRPVRAAAPFAVLAAVGLVLGGSVDQFCGPVSQSATFEVTSSCGPAGPLALAFAGGGLGGCGRCDDFVDATGGGAVGLPDRGELDAFPAGADNLDAEARWLASGHVVLAGPVALAGAVPPATVDRICRLGPTDTPGLLALTCTGPAPESACSGTFTLVEPAP